MADYSVGSENRDGVEVYRLQESSDVYAELTPALGNNLFAFHVDGPVLEDVAWEKYLARPTSFGIPILFPFPNRVSGDAFNFDGNRFELNPSRHGFVRDKEWKVIDSGASAEDGAWVRSRLKAHDYQDEILEQFPFAFSIEILYRVLDRTLHLEFSVRSGGTKEMPFGFGIHPYFERPGDGTVAVPANRYWELAESIPTGDLLEVDEEHDIRQPRGIDGLELDDIYTDLIPNEDGAVHCMLAGIGPNGNARSLSIEFDASSFPHVVVYTAPEPRTSICIEPYTCPTDAFNLMNRGIPSHVLTLLPGEEMHFDVRFRVT
jgi:aldose 1-epimerase